MITVPIMTIMALFCNSDQVGHDTLCTSSFQVSSKYAFIFISFKICTGGEARTPGPWFWRPMLYQLSYTRKQYLLKHAKSPDPIQEPNPKHH